MGMTKKSIDGSKILEKKAGRRTLVYPACGSDIKWIEFLEPDLFIGIDLEKFSSNPFNTPGCNTKTVFYKETDAITPPKIPKSDEIVLLLKNFDFIHHPLTFLSDLTLEERWETYHKENPECLNRYLKACEESALRKIFVIDTDGYGPVIMPRGYGNILSFRLSTGCRRAYDHCDSRPCERSLSLFNLEEMRKNLPRHYCLNENWIRVVTSGGVDYQSLPILDVYVKELGT